MDKVIYRADENLIDDYFLVGSVLKFHQVSFLLGHDDFWVEPYMS